MRTRRVVKPLGIGLLAALLTVSAVAPPQSDIAQAAEPAPNAAAVAAINVPGSVLAAAGPTGTAQARLAAAQSFNWQFTNPSFSTVSGSSTATPVGVSTLSASDQATWQAMTKDFVAPATRSAAAARVVSGTSVALLGFQVGLLAGNGVARISGFKDDAVCAQQNPTLTTLASVLNSVDCGSYQNAMTQTQRNSDQIPVSSMPQMTYKGVTVKYQYGRPWSPPGTDYNLLTCFNWSGQVDPGYRFTGVTVWGANNTSNGTGSNLENSNCGSGPNGETSNLSGWWITAPLMRYQMQFTDNTTGTQAVSPIATGTYSTPNPDRKWQCVVLYANGGASDRSTVFTEQSATLSGIKCPTFDPSKTVTGFVVSELTDGAVTDLFNISTTPAYQAWVADHPECRDGSCLTDLRKDGVSCFRQTTVTACANWFTSTDRSSHYTCFVGTRGVPLSDCYVYSPTFNGTNVDNGTAYGDPTTGATPTVQTSPTKRQRLAKLCKAFLSKTPASGTSTIGAVSGVSQSDCDTMPIYFPGTDLKSATDHRLSAVMAQPARVRLNYESSTNKTTDVKAASGLGTPRTWYTKTTTCSGTLPSGQSCDEFPNWSMLQGATVRSWSDVPLQELVSLKVLSTADNSAEGSWYGRFVANTSTGCKLVSATAAAPNTKGSEFLEIPGAVTQTEYICSGQ